MTQEPATRKTVTLPDSLWEDVATFRAAERIVTDTEAVRRLVLLGLRAARIVPDREDKA